MRNKKYRREVQERKYISRIKKRLHYILLHGHKLRSWREADEKVAWVKMLKHGKVYGRSTMSVLEKHFRIKKLRKESRKYEREEMDC